MAVVVQYELKAEPGEVELEGVLGQRGVGAGAGDMDVLLGLEACQQREAGAAVRCCPQAVELGLAGEQAPPRLILQERMRVQQLSSG